MPQVPTYQGDRVQARGIPNARVDTNAPIEAFGGGTSKVTDAIGSLAKTAQDFVLQEKKNADQIAVTEADGKAAILKSDLFWNTKTGVMTRQGKDAFGAPQEYGKKFDEGMQQISEGLSNDSQREAFNKKVTEYKATFNNQVGEHVFKQAKIFDDQVTDSRLAVAANDAALNYQDPGAVATSIGVQKQVIVEHAQRNGLPPEWVKQKTEEVQSGTQSAVVSRMLANGQDVQASDYFKANKDQFTGKDATHLERALEEGSIRGGSQRKSDEILQQGKSMTQSLEEARQIEDPKLRDATVNRVKDEFQNREIAKSRDEKARFDNLSQMIEQSKGDIDRAYRSPQWLGLSIAEKQSVEHRAQQLRSGIPPTTDWDKYYELKTLASAAETRDSFLEQNLMVLRPKMADSEFKELVSLQTSLRKGDDKDINGFRTSTQIVNDTLNAASIDPTPKPGSPDSQKVSNFRRMVDEQVLSLQEKTGKKAGTEEVQRIVDNLMVEGVTKKGWFWDDKKRAYELSPGETLTVDIKDVPKGEKAKIKASLQQYGKPVTDQVIMDLYNEKLKKNRGS